MVRGPREDVDGPFPSLPGAAAGAGAGGAEALGTTGAALGPHVCPLLSCEFRTHPPTWEVTGLPD